MSKRKDRERAKHTLYRSGIPISSAKIRRRKAVTKREMEKKLAAKIGLVLPGEQGPKLFLPKRIADAIERRKNDNQGAHSLS